mmetsp:Transcript_68981/g.195494  ORF Transcript_68981/g.195494 Transcript_68981/m.195494 type:complete len:345 (+) Transcript_68981:2603-3637(+)
MPEHGVLAVCSPAELVVANTSLAVAGQPAGKTRAQEPHLRGEAALVQLDLEEEAPTLLGQVGEAKGDPFHDRVAGLAAQVLRLEPARILQRGVGRCHLDQALQLLLSVLLQHVRILVQHGQPRAFNPSRVLRSEGATQAHVLHHQIGVPVLICGRDSAVVVHDAKSTILAALERLRVIVCPPKELLLPTLPRTVVVVQRPAGRLGFELVPVELICLQEAPDIVEVHVDHHRREVLDPAQHGLQLLLPVAQALEALPNFRQGVVVELGGGGADIRQRGPLARHQAFHSAHLRLREDRGPEGLLVIQDPDLPQRRDDGAVPGIVVDPARGHDLPHRRRSVLAEAEC